jgi:alpha-N-arabinofuranosidase
MANVAQLINCLQSLFLAHEDKFVTTPTFHVFDMYSAHQGAQSIRTICSAPRPSYSRNGQPGNIRGLSESASVSGKRMVLTIANPDAAQAQTAEIAIRGAQIKSITATVLAAKDIHAHRDTS